MLRMLWILRPRGLILRDAAEPPLLIRNLGPSASGEALTSHRKQSSSPGLTGRPSNHRRQRPITSFGRLPDRPVKPGNDSCGWRAVSNREADKRPALWSYFFIAMMYAAMSLASSRLSGAFGMVACGRRRNWAIMSTVTFFLAAMAAKEGPPLDLL